MKNKLFGMNITPDCSYCEYSDYNQGFILCKKGRKLKNNKCKKFKYDPLLRIPKNSVHKASYTEDDFKL